MISFIQPLKEANSSPPVTSSINGGSRIQSCFSEAGVHVLNYAILIFSSAVLFEFLAALN